MQDHQLENTNPLKLGLRKKKLQDILSEKIQNLGFCGDNKDKDTEKECCGEITRYLSEKDKTLSFVGTIKIKIKR